jgi:hypothetical protein
VSTTVNDLIAETERLLYAGSRDAMNVLNGPHDASQTAFTFHYDLGSIQPGAYLSVDLEVVYVVQVDLIGKSATVIRGMQGSTAATHAADSVVAVNPRFPGFAIFDAVNAELDSLSANGLFQVKNVELSYAAPVAGYDLTSVTDVLEVLRVKYDETGPGQIWPEIIDWELRRDSDTGDFASGYSIIIPYAQPGNAVRVTYAAEFARFTALGQDIETQTGLPDTAHDLPPLGAALRLQSVREGQRNVNELQSDTRRAQEVPPSANFNAARPYEALRMRRIREEARRLRRDWPLRRRVRWL